MIYPKKPENQTQRLKTLSDLNIMHSEAEDSYDNITALASYICKVPIALISLIGENTQWFKSKVGTDICEGDPSLSHCAHAILNPNTLLEIEDTRNDERFSDNPYTLADPPLLYYAGMPLKADNGVVLGTLCVLDVKPNKLNDSQKSALKALAIQVEKLFELHRRNLHLEKVKDQLKLKNNQLREFAGTVSHDMKMPLANMIITTDLLKAKYAGKIDAQGMEYLGYLKQSSFKLSNYISSILEHYESDTLTESKEVEFDIHDLLEEIIDLLNINYDCVINLPEENIIIKTNRVVLEQIFLNLIGNSLKYNNRDEIVIDVMCIRQEDYYNFTIKDNGIGIPKDKQEEIFNLFTVLAESDRSGNRGNGIGLSTVKKLVESMGGEISLISEVNIGTTFNFSIKRNLFS